MEAMYNREEHITKAEKHRYENGLTNCAFFQCSQNVSGKHNSFTSGSV